VLIVGASARAAAFSALRAGLQPECIDLFADADLAALCPTQRLAVRGYPRGFATRDLFRTQGPWLYTGGLENWPALIDRLAAARQPLWGNRGDVLRRSHSPLVLQKVLQDAKLPCPAIHVVDRGVPGEGRWVLKPLCGSGGLGIRFWNGDLSLLASKRRTFLQEFIDGESCSAVYVGMGDDAFLLGVTRQLIGLDWLHAPAFHYCGSVGPLAVAPLVRQRIERLGQVLARGLSLRGLFGVDCILRDGTPWPVEVNPRYTASVEVLEHAVPVAALSWHGRVFHSARFEQPPDVPSATSFVGKAILFARVRLTFPVNGPWEKTLAFRGPPHDLPAFADIPRAGECIQKGQPILTCFVRAESETACFGSLRQMAEDLDQWLFDR